MTDLRVFRRGRSTALLAAIVLVAAACGDDGSSPGVTDTAGGAQDPAGLPTQPFELVDGGTSTVAEVHDGRPMVLNFFASWCAPCRAEMPDFQEVHAEAGEEVAFYGLALNDAAGDAADIVDLTGVEYPWALDDGTVYAGFGGFSMPTTVYISADGEVVGRDDGEISGDDLRDRLDDLFGVTS